MKIIKLLIIGAGGHGKVVADIASLSNEWKEIVFLDDTKVGTKVNGYDVIGRVEDYKTLLGEFSHAFVAIGDNKTRMHIFEKLEDYGYDMPVLIHPFSYVCKNASIDSGTLVVAGAVVNANAVIGKGCIINTNCSVDHDCRLGSGVHISPGAHLGGTVIIGDNSWICIGATVIHDITIGYNVIVAGGATVINDIEDSVMVACIPARTIKNMSLLP